MGLCVKETPCPEGVSCHETTYQAANGSEESSEAILILSEAEKQTLQPSTRKIMLCTAVVAGIGYRNNQFVR